MADAPRIEEVMPSLLEFLEGAVVVAHNAPFDVGFLNYELQRLRGSQAWRREPSTRCPCRGPLLPGLANYRLKTVAEALGAPVAACHRALADAQAVAHVFVHLAGASAESGRDRPRRRCEDTVAYRRLRTLRSSCSHEVFPGVPAHTGSWAEKTRCFSSGKADRLADEVRALFLGGGARHRGLRKALALVESIDFEEADTPLEAVVREQQLLLEHLPPYNWQRIGPPKLRVHQGGWLRARA